MRTLVICLFLAAVAGGLYWTLRGDSGAGASSAAPDTSLEVGSGSPGAEGESPELLVPTGDSEPARATRSAPATEPVAAPTESSDTDDTALLGRVVDERGEPLAGAAVRALRAGGGMFGTPGIPGADPELARTRSDSAGRFRLELPAQPRVRIAIEAEGYAPLEESESLREGQEKDVGDVELDRGVTLAGRVFDSAGSPLAGVEVTRPEAQRGGMRLVGRDASVVLTETDEAGRFRIASQAVGPWQLGFRSDQHPDGKLDGVTDRAGDAIEDLELVLDDGFEITGRVVGMPSVDSELFVRAREPQSQSIVINGNGMGLGARARRASVAADGSFRVGGLSRDVEYELSVRQNAEFTFGAGRSRSAPVKARSGERGIEIAYDAGSALVFQVVDQRTKAPIESLLVSAGVQWTRPLLDDAGSRLREHSEGRVRFENLRVAEGETVTLELESVGYEKLEKKSIVLAASGDTDLGVIELAPVPVVRVRVTDRASGEPIAGARLSLTPQPKPTNGMRFSVRREISGNGEEEVDFGHAASHDGRTGADGWGTLTSFPGETCNLIVRVQGYSPSARKGLELPLRGTHEEHFEVGQGAEVRVLVVDGAGEPVSGARVKHEDTLADTRLALLGHGGGGERTDVSGVAVYEHLEPGLHKFRIDDDNESSGGMLIAFTANGEQKAETGWESVEVTDGEEYELTLVAPGRGTLSGIIREDGVPLASATISISEETASPFGHMLGAGGPTVRTDSQGRYELDDLKPADYTLRVTHALRAMPYETELAIVEGPNELDAELPVAVVEGRVFDEHGEPAAGATVQVSKREAEGVRGQFVIAMIEDDGDDAAVFTNVGGAASTKTDEDGRYELRGVAVDTDLYIEARAQGYEPKTSDDFQVAPGELRRGVDVHLSKGGTIVVKVSGGEEEAFGPMVRAEFIGETPDGDAVEPKLGVISGGEARLTGVRAGAWRVRLEEMGQDEPDAPDLVEPKTVEVHPSQESLVEFEL
ncbi:MAG: hypothetical protein GY711_01060 [bacterium]|nr:hypothetical protein [bacterium]